MAIFFPDIYSGQAGMSFKGALIALVKATQGTGYVNPDYVNAKARAARDGAFLGAYHFLTQGNGSGQADHCFSVVGKDTPLMLDWEAASGSDPGVADAKAFVTRYRQLGGIVVLLYLPHWYWSNNLGSPDLSWFRDQGMFLVTSNYTTYSDNGPGWAGYGGMTVAVWQYTSTYRFNGFFPVDFNAVKITVAQFIQLITGGITVKPEDMILRLNDSGPAVTYLQTRLNVWGAKIAVDGSFGPATDRAVREFQAAHKLTVDGEPGPVTWAALDAKPPVDPPPVFHGEYVSDGTLSLHDVAARLGTGVNALLRMTVTHYGGFEPELASLLVNVFGGQVPVTAPVAAGVRLYVD